MDNKTELEQRESEIACLWGLLDDISTAGDQFKPEITEYFKAVNRICDKRSLVAQSDGYKIFLTGSGKNITPM